MSIEKFMRNAVTPWMTAYGEHSDIVMSTRIRLARNLTGYRFPIAFTEEEAMAVDRAVTGVLLDYRCNSGYSYTKMSDLPALERQVLVEKHLISPQLAIPDRHGAVLYQKTRP